MIGPALATILPLAVTGCEQVLGIEQLHLDASMATCVPGAHVFCADFDRAGAVDDGWDDAVGPVEKDEAVWRSAPASATMEVSSGATDCSYAELRKALARSFDSASLALDVRVDEGPDDGAFAFLQVKEGCGFALEPRGVYRTDDATGRSGSPTLYDRAMPHGDWIHVELSLGLADNSFAVTINGESAIAKTALTSGCDVGSASIDIAAGIHCRNSGVETFRVHVDNVMVDGQ